MLKFTTTSAPEPTPAAERETILENPGFGAHFTDHMAAATWSAERGWHDDRVGALEPFTLHPASAVLHYAQEIFEGLKAYRHDDGSIWLFRPDMNAARLQRSARRLCLPELPIEDFLTSLEQLVTADAAWVPQVRTEESLYLRPFMVGTENFLGVRPSAIVDYRVIASPAQAYFTTRDRGNQPGGVRLWISDKYIRAAKGGTGTAKCGGNYGGSLAGQIEAQEHDCDQVLWTDVDGEGLEESGTMNLCVVTRDGELITPGLGTILEGVTRDSVMEIAPEHGLTVSERRITVTELAEGARSGEITEVFACGTAAVITPIAEFASERPNVRDVVVSDGVAGPKTLAIREHLLGLQLGKIDDPRGWLRRVV
ncbi:branched-chain amino acid aminotransferase [Epidermidibacterium keratini]|uniref:branched-chain-amino-acid transaminase n=1 Tax=Epidermidibacterium keratini TaxID=1891644 RepID=A0A7L4YPW8_9ACTN|nr:branched-chain amino acid aminotransferase [Epidermidibacterium keratini]QHC01108.1 branched-chain amino acid aminotransferase [Epidermidibacterium keratini]